MSVLPILFKKKQQGSLLNQWYRRILSTYNDDLIFLYPHIEKEGTVLKDYSGNSYDATATDVTWQQDGIGDGSKAADYSIATSRSGIPATINTPFNKNEFTLLMWIKADDSFWADSKIVYFMRIAAGNGTNDIHFLKTASNQIQAIYWANSVRSYAWSNVISYTGWMLLAMTVSKTGNKVNLIVNGTGVEATTYAGSVGVWAGSLDGNLCAIGSRYSYSKSYGFNQKIGPVALVNKVLTHNEIAKYSGVTSVRGILYIGDSKTASRVWTRFLIDKLNTATGRIHVELPEMIAISGGDTNDIKIRTDADIAAMTGLQTPSEIIINLGANDVYGNTYKPGFPTDARYIVEAYHTAFPNANIRLTKIWRRDCALALADINGEYTSMYSEYSWLKTGIDESNIIENGDDGVTYTTDGVHYNIAGSNLIAEAFKDAIIN